MQYYVRPYPYRVTVKFECGKVSIHSDNSVEALDKTEFVDNLLVQGWDWTNEVIPILKQIDTMARDYSMKMYKEPCNHLGKRETLWSSSCF
ncbi:hypothetical protein [Brevibacillus laterosporus]|uniref:Uncharacterized protein n=1 Tax=Brevibacillus laterosporus TaxID=1465 RepID=A0A0F7EHN9_BRELA|nr:hypothetical protein EX87_14575 [Brevibacillus laterosporus]